MEFKTRVPLRAANSSHFTHAPRGIHLELVPRGLKPRNSLVHVHWYDRCIVPDDFLRSDEVFPPLHVPPLLPSQHLRTPGFLGAVFDVYGSLHPS